MPAAKEKVEAIAPGEFKEKIKNLKDKAQMLMKFTSRFTKIPAGSDLKVGETVITRANLKSWQSQFIAELEQLPALYKAGYGGKRKAKKIGEPVKIRTNLGIANPVVVNETIVNFFKESGLGQIAGLNLDDFMLMTERISSRANLTSLFMLYAKYNSLYKNATFNKGKDVKDMNHQYIGADDLLKKYFGNQFTEIHDAEFGKLGAANYKEGDLKPGKKPKKQTKEEILNKAPLTYKTIDYYTVFNADNFRMIDVGKLINKNVYKKEQLESQDQERVSPLKGPEAEKYVTKRKSQNDSREQQWKNFKKTGNMPETFDFRGLAAEVIGSDTTPLAKEKLQIRSNLDNEHLQVEILLQGYSFN